MTQPQEPNYPYSAQQQPAQQPYAGQQGEGGYPAYGSYPTYPGYAGYPVYPTYHPESGWAMYPPPPPQPAPRTSRRRTAALAGVAAAAIIAVVGTSFAVGAKSTDGTGSIASQQQPLTPGTGSSNNGGTGNGNTVPTIPGSGNSGNTGNNGSTSANTAEASATQQVGVVDIYTRLKYEKAAAAGTGLVIDSNGVILTNNHVIEGSTSIRVVVVATGKSYVAKVVGTAPTEDIAVLQLSDASGLKTANIGDSDQVKVGDAVTGVGNAGGAGGTPSAASGTVKSLKQTITASDESGTDSEKLHGVIVTDAPIQSGDSGGPLFNAKDEVVGIDTAASTTGQTAGFAIPINTATKIAQQIRTGVETTVIHIGYPAFLGVSVKDTNGAGALIATTESGLPADKAGIVAGDVVTSLNGTKVTSSTTLRTAIAKLSPGDTATVVYTDANGTSHTTKVTTIAGPAD